MNRRQLNRFDCINSSVKSSKIPRLVFRVEDNPIEDNIIANNRNNLNQKLHSLNLNGKQSRIPIKKSRIALIINSLSVDQISGSEAKSEHKLDTNLNESNNKLNDFECKVKLRSVPGRSGLKSRKSSGTKSEPIDWFNWKEVLEILRSNLSADNKFRAIKRYRDKRLGLICEMQGISEGNCDQRVREWVDSGYMSNTNSVREPEDLFAVNQSKCEDAIDTSLPIRPPQQLWSRRRSYNSTRAMDLIALNNKYNSFNSDISLSSISSIESLLDSRRGDPEELLLALGFGYVSEEQPLNRIPQRFFESPSSAKGVNHENLGKCYGLMDAAPSLHSSSFSPTDSRERSYSCGRISERFHKRLNSKESIMNLPMDLPEIITSSPSMVQLQSPQSESILNPANRRFLENQGKQEDQNQLSSKRLIIGTKSYKLDIDGDPIAFPKTPSPVATTPVQTDNEMDASESSKEQITCNSLDNIQSQTYKRKLFKRQNSVSDQVLDFDMSSELSSSTTTLVETVINATNDNAAHDISDNSSMSSEKRNAFSQTDNQLNPLNPLTQSNVSEAVEAAFVVAIQSLRLSLEFYKHQSLKMAKLSEDKYKESSSDFTDEDLNRLSNIHRLRQNIHQELVDMDTLLNKHLNKLKTCNDLETSFTSQAHIFTEAVKKMTELLRDQQNI